MLLQVQHTDAGRFPPAMQCRGHLQAAMSTKQPVPAIPAIPNAELTALPQALPEAAAVTALRKEELIPVLPEPATL